ncbi:MAG: hypothetical protein IJ696_06020 [Ruminococcus sp.]|nr:hypothetical protein [Ruminococcus sp.]
MNRYADIYDAEYTGSGRHRKMLMRDRAAQFAPFAALTGFDAIINEQARYTDSFTGLCEDDLDKLDEKLALLTERLPECPEVTLVYFVKDRYKPGGSFEQKTGVIRLIDTVSRQFVFYDKSVIALDDVVSIEL